MPGRPPKLPQALAGARPHVPLSPVADASPASPSAASPPTSSAPLPPCPTLAQLPRASARLCLQVARFVERDCHIPLHDTTLLLAVSGGADSLALLTIFTALRSHCGHRLLVAHIDHGLRPESPAEARAVAALCAAWGISCHLHAAPVRQHAAAKGVGLEEAGRDVRYAMLEQLRAAHAAQWIATGHHREDLAEDMLLRFTRGTGWPALGGMQAMDPHRRLVRPLLLCDPASLRILLHSYGISWHEDASNADMAYTRNRLRHTVMPLLRAENPALHQGVENLWTLAQEDAQHWERLITTALAEYKVALSPPRITLPKVLLHAVDKATRLRLYMKAIHSLGQGQARATTLFQLDAAWQDGRGNTLFQLHGKVSARLLQGVITFEIG